MVISVANGVNLWDSLGHGVHGYVYINFKYFTVLLVDKTEFTTLNSSVVVKELKCMVELDSLKTCQKAS